MDAGTAPAAILRDAAKRPLLRMRSVLQRFDVEPAEMTAGFSAGAAR
jgi:hypothetical protein